MLVETLIEQAAACKASDLHIAYGVPPKVRRDGELQDLEGFAPLTDQDCETVAQELLGESMPALGERDLSIELAGRRVRVNLFRQSGHVSAALRILADSIPELDALGLPPAVQNFPALQRGIVLVTGETGSGKSTTLAAILRRINETRRDHIITLEDPIEYIHAPVQCLINQREIGRDTESYAEGLRAILREDPDVILIGEMRDLITIETALTAAETGHLVFATLHTNSAADSIDRMVDVFPAERQRQIRMQLSMTLQAVLAQQLLPRRGGGRVAACELMVVSPAIRNLIREGKTPQIANAVATSADLGGITMDNALIRLFKDKLITADTARAAAHDPDYVKKNTLF
ncbi:PilT/PilU family type 4a pilus ATPase [Oscillibacter valericigenes]|uniref:type IV pilus twitching motility protein PilT n=1 Tax=Oscillibacter valericigenes TaxID=351091 RepID=UPI001F2270E6|nr:PilT/PilU family type 4a pilus ATPase [Oscillibacter valericigenes]MCF2615668.1 PilT/PilU family type 4a pilus ATPase [Oscillibacter valericigenes]